MLIDALSVLCAQLTRDLFAIAKFLSCLGLSMQHGGSQLCFVTALMLFGETVQ